MPNKKSLIILTSVVVLLVAAVAISYFCFSSGRIDRNDNDNSVVQTLPANNSNSSNSASDDLVYDGKAPVYVTVYSHNEDSWAGLVNTEAKYLQYRQGLVERAKLFSSYGIDWDWQSDQPVVEAMLKYETSQDILATTGGKNILQFLSASGASLDPHAHNNNYADIVYLMKQLNVTPSGVIGGTIALECGGDLLGFINLASWHNNVRIQNDGYVHGEDYPEALWKPTILSDPGMGHHYFDDWSSGVWRPGDGDSFYSDSPANKIIYIGEGYPHDTEIIGSEHAGGSEIYATDGQYVKELVEKIQNKILPTGRKDGTRFMYTASIHVRDTIIVSESSTSVNTIEGVTKVLNELKPLKDSGKIIFVNFEDAAKIWQTDYKSVPWYIDLTSFSFYDQTKQQAEEYCAAQEGRVSPKDSRKDRQ